MDIKKNHAILTTSLFDTAARDALVADNVVASTGFAKLKPGWNVVVLYTWLSQKLQSFSTDVLKLMGQFEDGMSIEDYAQGFLNCAIQDLVVNENYTLGIYGGNILSPTELDLKHEDMLKVVELTQSHPLQRYLAKTIPAKFGANWLTTRKLSTLISLIDFEIPSIACLLQALGYNFLVANPFLEQGVVVGTSKYAGYFYILYDNYYKIMKGETLAALASEGLLKQPLTITQSTQLGVETNHYQGA